MNPSFIGPWCNHNDTIHTREGTYYLLKMDPLPEKNLQCSTHRVQEYRSVEEGMNCIQEEHKSEACLEYATELHIFNFQEMKLLKLFFLKNYKFMFRDLQAAVCCPIRPTFMVYNCLQYKLTINCIGRLISSTTCIQNGRRSSKQVRKKKFKYHCCRGLKSI